MAGQGGGGEYEAPRGRLAAAGVAVAALLAIAVADYQGHRTMARNVGRVEKRLAQCEGGRLANRKRLDKAAADVAGALTRVDALEKGQGEATNALMNHRQHIETLAQAVQQLIGGPKK